MPQAHAEADELRRAYAEAAAIEDAAAEVVEKAEALLDEARSRAAAACKGSGTIPWGPLGASTECDECATWPADPTGHYIGAHVDAMVAMLGAAEAT